MFSALILAVALAATTATSCADTNDAAGPDSTQTLHVQKESNMKIRLNIEDTVVTATLEDNATSRDFISLLPLTLTLEDYASTEKISMLTRRLSTEGAPSGYDPSVGDITYYAPWGNLALFHRDFGYSSGLIKLGTMDSGVELLRRPGPLKVTIERVEEQP